MANSRLSLDSRALICGRVLPSKFSCSPPMVSRGRTNGVSSESIVSNELVSQFSLRFLFEVVVLDSWWFRWWTSWKLHILSSLLLPSMTIHVQTCAWKVLKKFFINRARHGSHQFKFKSWNQSDDTQILWDSKQLLSGSACASSHHIVDHTSALNIKISKFWCRKTSQTLHAPKLNAFLTINLEKNDCQESHIECNA